MKKSILLFFNLLIISISIFSQDIKTGKGTSSILLPTTNIGVDVGEASLSFKMNNFPQSKINSNGFVWGVYAKGESKEGIASIFSSSEIVPSSSFSLIYGYSFSNSKQISQEYEYLLKKELKDSVKQLIDNLKDSLEVRVIQMVNNIEDKEVQKFIRAKVAKALNSPYLKYNKLEEVLKKLSENMVIDPEIAAEASFIYDSVKKNKTWSDIKRMNKIISSEIDEISADGYYKFTIYGHLGMTGTKFNLFKGWDSTNIENSFYKKSFSGITGGFGISHNFNSKWIFGFRYTYEETNNLETLSTKDYKVTSSFNTSNSTGATQVSKTAYNDNFKKAFLNRYDLDLIRFFNIGENTVIISDLYIRINESNNQNSLPTHQDIGVSSSFFKKKGKFIGGIYLEIIDLNQAVEKLKPVEDQELKSWYKRLSIGIYAKYSFTNIASMFN